MLSVNSKRVEISGATTFGSNKMSASLTSFASLKSFGILANLAEGAGINARVSATVKSGALGLLDVEVDSALFQESVLCRAIVAKDFYVSVSGRDEIAITTEVKLDMFNQANPLSALIFYRPMCAGLLVEGNPMNNSVDVRPFVRCTVPGPWSTPATVIHSSAALGRDNTIHLEARMTSLFSDNEGGPSMTFVLSPHRIYEPFSLSFQYNL